MVYISLTSVPDRYTTPSFLKCLDRLLDQDTQHPYKVVLNIPRVYKNYPSSFIPVEIQNLTLTRGLIIIQDEIDYGPITNLLYPIKHLDMKPDDIIIVVDDDQMYSTNLVRFHILTLGFHPKNHAICLRGNQPQELRTWVDSSGKRVGQFFNTSALFPVTHDVYLKIPDHWHSVSYRRSFFQADIFDEKFLSMTWNNDLLMGYYALTHGFYFLCAYNPNEVDFRPVNTLGRAAHTFPIESSIPNDLMSGCGKWRQLHTEDIWSNLTFSEPFTRDCKPNFIE